MTKCTVKWNLKTAKGTLEIIVCEDRPIFDEELSLNFFRCIQSNFM